MAFLFSGLSSSIGKRLLLYGLRQVDILDKDPADFVSVDVGKRTTLEVRDVGLHVKKLISLLKLNLPPEIQLSGARASLLRVTFILEFGVPQISIEVDGIQVQARLLDNVEEEIHGHPHQSARDLPKPFTQSSAYENTRHVTPGDEHVPTVDELAQSFIRTEPDQEIYDLEQELEHRSSYMQESATSSEDGDEVSAGMGAPLSLPTYLRDILNTALDRLSIVINNIEIEMEDAFSDPTLNAAKQTQSSPASLRFHIERVSVDTLTSQDIRIEVQSSSSPTIPNSKLGKRRLHIENICARLISDADNFISMSRMSQPSSPVLTHSEVSLEQVEPFIPPETEKIEISEKATASALIEKLEAIPHESLITPSNEVVETFSLSSMNEQHSPQISSSMQESSDLTRSKVTVDDDRFADAASDDGLNGDTNNIDLLTQSHQSIPTQELGQSNVLYDDEGLLEYAMQNSLLGSEMDAMSASLESTGDKNWKLRDSGAKHQELPSELSIDESFSDLPTVSILGMPSHLPITLASQSQPTCHGDDLPRLDELPISNDHADEAEELPAGIPQNKSSPILPYDDELAESQIFIDDEAGSMYMSAVSAAQPDSEGQRRIPGGWQSSTSSRAASSESSDSVPDEMVSGSILAPLPEADDGYETPRPGSRQTTSTSPLSSRIQTPTPHSNLLSKLSKLFLTIDEITVWFPLGLDAGQELNMASTASANSSAFDFTPPNLGEDSIFAEMPGSFSNYAHSSSNRRFSSTEESRMRAASKSSQPHVYPTQKSDTSSSIVGVEVGSICGHIDISTGRIMLGMFNRALQAVVGNGSPKTASTKTNEPLSYASSSLELSVKHICVAWLENISTESVHDLVSTQSLSLYPKGAILRTNLSGICLTSLSENRKSRAKLKIEKLSISSLDHDIISFQAPRPRSNQSVNALPEHFTHDIEVDYEQGTERRITVVTRPVKIVFDVQSLDDALSGFGGFSGMLELSSSISSTNTVPSPAVFPSQPRPRGVHFGDGLPLHVKARPPPTSVPKVQVQFGEVSITLKGKACAVQLQTTSVRIAVRESNVRLKLSEVQLLGPYVDVGQISTPLVVEVRGTTVNFVNAPEETDLARLISLIMPSKDPYENNDDILIDTLLRQRRKGSVLRVEVTEVGVRISDLEQMKVFEALGTELAGLSKVAKYLPDDDRPGLLTLAAVKRLHARIAINKELGDITMILQNVAVAHVGVPALLATEIGSVVISREDEILVHEVVTLRSQEQLPAIMVRMVGDEMEPIAKAKFFNLCIEYRVSTVMAALGISDVGKAEDVALGIASSVATITAASSNEMLSRISSHAASPATNTAKPLQIDLLLRNCAIGLNPRNASSKGLFVLTEAHVAAKQAKSDYSVVVELRKASMHAIDDISRLNDERDSTSRPKFIATNRYLQELGELGFVSLSSISAAEVCVNITGAGSDTPQLVDVEFKNQLFVIESCADSTQTLVAILNGLQPATPPSTAEKYRTVVPLQEMMQSFTGNAIFSDDDGENDDFMRNADLVEDEVPTNLEFVASIYNSQSLSKVDEMGDGFLREEAIDSLATPLDTRRSNDQVLSQSLQEKHELVETEPNFDFNETYFVEPDLEQKGKARKWDSTKNQYHLSNEFKAPDAPLKVRVRDVNVIWNLFDGYDWPRTRSIISQAVDDVEARAEERRQQARDDEDDDFVEEDFLFNSVWIGVPVKDEKGALARRINHDIDDLASETGSYAASTATRSTSATARSRGPTKSRRRLKLERSKHKKIAFSIMGLAVDLIIFPPDTGETISSIDVRVRDLEVFDHVPTSTWKKFVTCAVDPAARELNRPMVHLELVTVKPVTDLAASELVIKVTVLPLRLHVDQDALDFITRFFEFKDDSVPAPPPTADQPFIQRLEVMAVSMRLDYKPKRVDYRGLRSGHTTEFMNFLILDGSDITLRHAIVYGITSFDKLHKTLNDVWSPDVKSNQLPGVLAGLAAVRPLVNVGSGMRDLVVVPVREYKKDGRIVRSLQKGVYAFARNTTSEVARLGAKVAIGTQTLLEGAEDFLNPQTSPSSRQQQDWDGEDPSSDAEEPRAVSHYANQPLSVRAGLQSAARHLERDLLTARDAVIAIPQEVMEEGSGVGVAKAIARHAPTIILKPALGATKALGNALLGVGNALDQGSRRKVEDKYKSY